MTARGGATSIVRVAITTNTLDAGGAEKQRVLLANAFAGRGLDVQLYCLQREGALRSLLAPEVGCSAGSHRAGAQRRHDVVITGTTNTENAFAMVSRTRRRCRHWMTVVHNPMGPDAPPLARFSRWALVAPDAVAGLTDWHAAQLRERWSLRVDLTLPNGTDLDWAPAVRAARSSTSSFEFDLGYIGRISMRHKGLDRLLEALAQPEAGHLTLAIAGDGPDRDELLAMAEHLGVADRLTLLGYVPTPEFFRRVRSLALFSRYEGQPMVLLEAAAANAPVVASAHAGASADRRVTVLPAVVTPRAAATALAETAHAAGPPASMPRSVGDMADDYLAACEQLARAGAAFGRRLRRLPTVLPS